MALSGVDQTSVTQAAGARDAVAALMAGMRVALNTISDRHLFPTRAESVERLLRQVSDSFNLDND